jgi:hypothetical protein
MSGVYPYCVVPAGRQPPPGLTGINGGPVRGYEIGPFTVWASEEDAAPPVDLDRISAHHGVVVAAVSMTTALPIRFGSWAPSGAALATRIEESRVDLEAALASAVGRVEMGVTVDDVAQPAGPAAPSRVPGAHANGRAYMRALSQWHSVRKERHRKQDEVAAEIARELEGLVHETRVRHQDAPGLVSVAHLIAREDESLYRGRLANLAASGEYAGHIHVTGPWPPYSFAVPSST